MPSSVVVNTFRTQIVNFFYCQTCFIFSDTLCGWGRHRIGDPSVTYTAYDDGDDGPPQEPKRERLFSIAIVVTLVIVGVVSAFLWRAYGNDLAALRSFASANAPSNASAGQAASAAEKGVGLQAFQTFQLQLAGQTQESTRLLTSQQAEIKRLSDQVAVLSGKIDALQQLAKPTPVQKQATPPARKKPAPSPTARSATGASPPPPPLKLNP
jgi:hypothetical protein